MRFSIRIVLLTALLLACIAVAFAQENNKTGSISGQVELPEQVQSGRIVFYVVPAEKDKGEEVLRYFAVAVTDDGSFSMHHVPPGRYWTVAKLVTGENEPDVLALRLTTAAATRARLRREAEAGKSEIELKPCQSVNNHKLPLRSN